MAGKQLWLKLSRTLATVRREPQEIVTVLRVIEREEQADAELRDALATGYVPPGRPKRWRQRALQVGDPTQAGQRHGAAG